MYLKAISTLKQPDFFTFVTPATADNRHNICKKMYILKYMYVTCMYEPGEWCEHGKYVAGLG